MRATRTRNSRREFLKQVYDGQMLESGTGPVNELTAVDQFLEDVIRAIPSTTLRRQDIGALFRDALERVK